MKEVGSVELIIPTREKKVDGNEVTRNSCVRSEGRSEGSRDRRIFTFLLVVHLWLFNSKNCVGARES